MLPQSVSLLNGPQYNSTTKGVWEEEQRKNERENKTSLELEKYLESWI
jgi:hypothetical protein